MQKTYQDSKLIVSGKFNEVKLSRELHKDSVMWNPQRSEHTQPSSSQAAVLPLQLWDFLIIASLTF